uniref:Uncharacterized protein n=3 Tax=Bursaphelenchus xylophilus TaxID=6326 RepID=A0A1I7SNW6_BURXY
MELALSRSPLEFQFLTQKGHVQEENK